MNSWLQLDLVRLLVLAVPAFLVHTALVAWTPPTTRPAWMVALAVFLAVACLLLFEAVRRRGRRMLGRGYLAFFLAFVFLFSLAADMDLLAGKRERLAGFDQQIPTNVLGLGWFEDWHYLMAPDAPPAGELLMVTFPSFDGMTREEVRQQIAFLIRQAQLHGARGIALDIYFEQPSHFDLALRRTVEQASAAGMPVVFGFRQIEKPSGALERQLLPPELEAIVEHRGHLQGYREADGKVRLIPTVLPKVGKYPALSEVVARLLSGRSADLPTNRLLRFVRPIGGIERVPFSPRIEGSTYRDRFVIAGSSSKSDRVATPFGELQGVEIHAWAANAIAHDAALVDVDPRYTLPLIFAACYVLTVFQARGVGRRRVVLAAMVLSAAVVAVAVIVLRVNRLWLEVSYPLIAIWLFVAIFRFMELFQAKGEHTVVFSDSTAGANAAATIDRAGDSGTFDVFLSHNGQDKPAVRKLYSALRARGLTPWLDEEELVPGGRWQEALEEIITTVPAVAVLIGADGLGPWEEAEMRGALAESVRRGLPVIPVLLPGAPHQPALPLFLTQYTWVDLRGGFTAASLDRLQWGITGRKP